MSLHPEVEAFFTGRRASPPGLAPVFVYKARISRYFCSVLTVFSAIFIFFLIISIFRFLYFYIDISLSFARFRYIFNNYNMLYFFIIIRVILYRELIYQIFLRINSFSIGYFGLRSDNIIRYNFNSFLFKEIMGIGIIEM
jgi:hypothetical protein